MANHKYARLKGILFGAKSGAHVELPLLESEVTRLEKAAHFCAHVGESFVGNRCLIRASALSFSTLLALIPMLAVAISVASGLLRSDGEEDIYGMINKAVAYLVPPMAADAAPRSPTSTNAESIAPMSSPTNLASDLESNAVPSAATNSLTVANTSASVTAANTNSLAITAQRQAAKSIHEFVQNTRSGALGIFGMLALVWVAISMLANVEATFNDIWGVARGRRWFWRIFLYWGALTLGPLALIGAYSVVGIHMTAARQFVGKVPLVGGLIYDLLPLAILWLVFSLLYRIVPNTKVQWRSALIGGFVAALLWHLNNVLGYLFVSRIATNNIIYGSLWLVPVLMAGLYFSWAILLFGVQVSYAWQNRRSYIQDKCAESVNQRGREFIALRLMTLLGLRFQYGQPPAGVREIAGELSISSRLAQKVMETLLTARLITEVAGEETAYCPARPLDTISAHQVLLAVRSVNRPMAYTSEEPLRDEIYGEFARIEEAERVAAASVSIAALVNRARAKLAGRAIQPPATALALPEPATVELAVLPVAGPAAEESKPAEPPPEKPKRRIAVPEDKFDFPL